MSRWIPLRIALVAAVLLVGLTALIAREEQLRQGGQEVLLRTGLIDPRELLTGHYAQLSLTDALDKGEPCPPGASGRPFLSFLEPKKRDRWVSLAPRGERHLPTGEWDSRDQALKAGPIAMQGSLSCRSPFPGADPDDVAQTTLDIGVERFHADQSMAQDVEAAIRQPDAKARPLALISVGTDGRARLKGIIVNGRRITLSWW